MRALLCDCGQHLKADDKEALYRQVREHLGREDRPREHPLGRFLEEEQVKQLVANRSYNLEDIAVVHTDSNDRSRRAVPMSKSQAAPRFAHRSPAGMNSNSIPPRM